MRCAGNILGDQGIKVSPSEDDSKIERKFKGIYIRILDDGTASPNRLPTSTNYRISNFVFGND